MIAQGVVKGGQRVCGDAPEASGQRMCNCFGDRVGQMARREAYSNTVRFDGVTMWLSGRICVAWRPGPPGLWRDPKSASVMFAVGVAPEELWALPTTQEWCCRRKLEAASGGRAEIIGGSTSLSAVATFEFLVAATCRNATSLVTRPPTDQQ